MNSLNLVNLIGSLSPTEKQYFKKSHDPESEFVRLFDYINKSKSYDSENARKFLLKKRKSTKVNKYTSGHLSVLKNYLHEKIMESLRSQYIPKRTSYDLMTRAMNVDILLEKGLYNLAKNEIEVAKKKTSKSSFPIERLMLYRRESIINFYTDYSDSSMDEINQLYNDRIQASEQLLLEIKYARILTILSYQYFKNEKDLVLLQSFIQEDYMQDESLAKEFGTKYLFYWVHAQFAEFQNQPEKAIQFFEKTVLTWLEHTDYIKAHPRMYLGTCTTYLKYILQQKKSYTLVLKETDFKDMLSRIPTLGLEKDVESKWNLLFYTAKILAHRLNQNYAQINLESAKILASINASKTTTDFTKVMIYYFVSLSNFHQKKFKEAFQHLHNLNYNDDIQLNANPEYHVHVLRLYLMTQFELNNYKFLKTELKKVKLHLQQKELLNEFETLFIKMISQLISSRFLEKQDGVFARFYPQLNNSIVSNGFEEQIEYQYVINWIKQNGDNF